ncbi:MAG: SDR family oxidoreductase [bacterium]
MFNKTALITGASRGLGRNIAREFTEHGFNTLLCARNMDKLKDLADELNQLDAGDSIALPIDFHEPESLEDLAEAIPRQWPPISVLVNNAGYYDTGFLEETDLETFQNHMEVNCQGPFILMKKLLPKMADRNEGFVCNILAGGAVEAAAEHCAFNASKFGLRGLTRSLAREYQHQGVHISGLVIDGEIDSPKKRKQQPERSPETFLDPRSIAKEILHLYQQPRDAWSLETDLRPHNFFNRQ